MGLLPVLAHDQPADPAVTGRWEVVRGRGGRWGIRLWIPGVPTGGFGIDLPTISWDTEEAARAALAEIVTYPVDRTTDRIITMPTDTFEAAIVHLVAHPAASPQMAVVEVGDIIRVVPIDHEAQEYRVVDVDEGTWTLEPA